MSTYKTSTRKNYIPKWRFLTEEFYSNFAETPRDGEVVYHTPDIKWITNKIFKYSRFTHAYKRIYHMVRKLSASFEYPWRCSFDVLDLNYLQRQRKIKHGKSIGWDMPDGINWWTDVQCELHNAPRERYKATPCPTDVHQTLLTRPSHLSPFRHTYHDI